MFKFVLFVALAAAASALPPQLLQHAGQYATVARSDDVHADAKVDSDVRPDGFHYAYTVSNGIEAHAAGDEYGNHDGGFSWTSPEGVPVKVDYIANENGYQPSSANLPVGPPIPDYILRSLEYIRTHPNQENQQYQQHTQQYVSVPQYQQRSVLKSLSG